MNAFSVVEQFERRIAEYCGAQHCVTVASGTWAIFLALQLERRRLEAGMVTTGHSLIRVECPARTFISVPMAILQAGMFPRIRDFGWLFRYRLYPSRVVDAALDFGEGCHADGGLTCLSFQARKLLPIGEGGAILLDDKAEADELRAMRYSGRRGPLYRVEDVTTLGWNCYLTPEKAARGLHLMEYVSQLRDPLPAEAMNYPDLRQSPLLRPYSVF